MTGRVPSREKLKRILEAAEERGIKVLSDEVYAELSFNEHTPGRELYENAITVKSFLKLYSMTGFRLGYAIAQEEDAKKLRGFIEVTATCVPPFVQRAGIKALELRDRIKKRVRNEYRMRVKRAVRILNGLEFYPPEGAFYVFLHVPGDGLSFAERLLNRGVAVFPGVAFGDYRDFIRISFTWKGFEEGLKIIREEVEWASKSSATEKWEGSLGNVLARSTR
ncbi:pyridoxal phosphate-dependent aminotransferase [Thermococcus piezophilus]|uniref:pyridoxal phosphate-dependent aminotransferase n=1 Tax=Thermococcus piezophilus TaxID=1712654 RepID=UPI001F3DF79B|nr:pyridoxal phosphate-dependent aminotransferase [Thermococcus piezophilus]